MVLPSVHVTSIHVAASAVCASPMNRLSCPPPPEYPNEERRTSGATIGDTWSWFYRGFFDESGAAAQRAIELNYGNGDNSLSDCAISTVYTAGGSGDIGSATAIKNIGKRWSFVKVLENERMAAVFNPTVVCALPTP